MKNRKRMCIEGTITNEIQIEQSTWFGYERRLLKQLLEWIRFIKKKRERPNITWIKGIRKTTNTKISY